MRRALIAMASLAALGACNRGTEDKSAQASSNETAFTWIQSGEFAIADAQVRLPVVPGRPAAAYFSLRNDNGARVLASISADKAERAELHESRMEGGVMRMEKLDNLPLPANATVTFAPGGKHIMLFGLDPALKAGDPVALDLKFTDGTLVQVNAKTHIVADGSRMEM